MKTMIILSALMMVGTVANAMADDKVETKKDTVASSTEAQAANDEKPVKKIPFHHTGGLENKY